MSEVLIDNIWNKASEKLEGVKERGPNNFRARLFQLDAALLDDWVNNPRVIRSSVPRYFKGMQFDPKAQLVIGATEPWEEEGMIGITSYEGGTFIQARLIPSNMRRGAVVYTLSLKTSGDVRFDQHEEIPYLSAMPSYTQFLPRRFATHSGVITISRETLDVFDLFLIKAEVLPSRQAR